MDKRSISLLNEIIRLYGNEHINANTVAREMGSDYQIALMRNGTKVSGNIYSIPNALLEDVVEEKSNYSDKITDFIHNDNLVPSFDPNYVPFGCYNEVLTVIKSNVFLPIYIVGESGNGKCHSFTNKIKIRVKKDVFDKYFDK